MKIFKIAATAVILAASSVQANAQSALNEILSGGVLKVGTTGDWNPMTMRDVATNTYQGYDIDVMTALAADLGVEVEFVPTDWKTLVAGVTAGQYHITGSASVSPARAKAAGYSNSYFSLATVPLTLKKNADRFQQLGRPEQSRRFCCGYIGYNTRNTSKAVLSLLQHTASSKHQHVTSKKCCQAVQTQTSRQMLKQTNWLLSMTS